jgi:hypothetical protein
MTETGRKLSCMHTSKGRQDIEAQDLKAAAVTGNSGLTGQDDHVAPSAGSQYDPEDACVSGIVETPGSAVKSDKLLQEKYPPSLPCSCPTCVSFCRRPGWWTVEEAARAINSGLAERMMVEVSPDRKFCVLSPAFKGNEANYALQIFSGQGCTFLKEGLCELYGSAVQPLECRYCHHDRHGLGTKCHLDIETDWNTEYGKRLIVKWGNITGFWKRQGLVAVEK